MGEGKDSFSSDARNVLRGVCMGCADVVPGVSGGTVALILGIYERLVSAISRVDRAAFKLLWRREWNQLADHLDLRFLTTLGGGIASGIVALSLVVGVLLNNELSRALTFAMFFGAIFASAIVVARMIRTATGMQSIRCVALGLFGALTAYWLSTLHSQHATATPSYAYVFLCGCTAICAMILPGISGAMMLLVLGIYEHLTEIPRNLLAGRQVTEGLLTIFVFGTGCAIGLVLFSKLLRWLLATHHATTMSLLCGFMFGALRKLWPFQHDLTPEVEKFKEKTFQVYVPQEVDGQVIAVFAAIVIAAAVVFIVDRMIRRADVLTRQQD